MTFTKASANDWTGPLGPKDTAPGAPAAAPGGTNILPGYVWPAVGMAIDRARPCAHASSLREPSVAMGSARGSNVRRTMWPEPYDPSTTIGRWSGPSSADLPPTRTPVVRAAVRDDFSPPRSA